MRATSNAAMCTENYDPCYPDQPVADRYLPMWANLPAFTAKPAFIWADDDAAGAGGVTSRSSRSALTYSQLNSTVERMARSLLGCSLRRGDSVLVLASPGLRLVALLFACQRAGLTAVPIVPPDSAARFGPTHAHLLRAVAQTKPEAVVADGQYIKSFKKTLASGVTARPPGRLAAMLSSLHWLAVDDLEQGHGDDGPAEAHLDYTGCGPDDVYLIQYTSGATGVPKPVTVTAGSAAHNVRAARKAYDLHPGSVVVSWLPQYHDCGLMFLLLTVVAGATCVLASPDAFVRRPRLWLELATEFRATCTPVPSFALPLVLKRGRRAARGRRQVLELGSLRNLILINEPIYKSVVDEFVAAFRRDGLRATSVSPSYGLAENCTFVSTAWLSGPGCTDGFPSYKKILPSARLSPPPASSTLVSVCPAPEIEIAVVDEETGEPVEDGVEGEVWVSSPSNASGYLDHPSATLEVFCARVPGRAGACFMRTGDRGVIVGAERYLYVVGRSADVISLDGGQRRVHAHYIETAAYGGAPESLRGGCVAAFTTPSPVHADGDVTVVAELQKGSGGDHKGLCEGIRAAVCQEEGVTVRRVVLVKAGAVPKTTSGKVRRGATRLKLLAGEMGIVFEARFDSSVPVPVPVPGVGDEEDMTMKSAASWVAGESGENIMAAGFGIAGRCTRLQSFL